MTATESAIVWLQRGCNLLALLCLSASRSEAALAQSKEITRSLLEFEDLSDTAMATVLVWREVKLGVGALISVVAVTVFWMAYVEKLVWTYNFFGRHEYNVWWFISSIFVYMFFFDAWFYVTHRWLHESKFMWDTIHIHHHAFKEPTAFCQDAVHPVEAIVQGPFGHYLPTLFFPIHPLAHALFGFLSSIFAVAAHDGRTWDLNNHYYHHCAGKGRRNSFNYSLYWPLWDAVFNTRLVFSPSCDVTNTLWRRKAETAQRQV
ncbi:uncharacterized protein MONBRDRAFT_39006 [Monosiga brevicollis MX1]|uniref:Fatty acid hydroxylase domain-containing protein n=1 Tax=Monosiga brevicollis TaxID=81824 RepID=A9VBL3_MONBE|nr:uncharacterized protein MONBRDRAFT_39006 [Monosiga brevicollis MX1]EDQ85117.1 predicted protein [Monosiga brevicollis MX1]|eukprot:XP_001750121.1 hypothetical protein [Monosiga brevicollis MX1]